MREKQEAIRKARVIKLQQDAAHEAIKEAFSKDPTKAGDGPGFYIHQSYHPQFGKVKLQYFLEINTQVCLKLHFTTLVES